MPAISPPLQPLEVAEIEEAIVEARQPKAAPAKTGTVDQAIADLINAMDLKSKAALDDDRVIELINQHSRKIVVEVNDKTTGEVRTVEGVRYHKDFPNVLSCIAAGVNVVAVGPAGSGKSTIFEQAAAALDLPYYFTGAVQQEHKIMGFVDANGMG